MSNEQGFVSASDYEAWKKEHELIQRRALEAAPQAELVSMAGIGAKDVTGANAAQQAHDGPLDAPGQQTGAPGRLFQRSDILAIIRGQKAIATTFQAREAMDALERIIASLEA